MNKNLPDELHVGGKPIRPTTDFHHVFNDRGMSLADVLDNIEEKNRKEDRIYHTHDYVIDDKSSFENWVYGADGLHHKSVIIMPNVYVHEGSINLSKLKTMSITGVIEGGDKPKIIIRNPGRYGIFYEDAIESKSTDVYESYVSRTFDIRFFVKNIEIEIQIDEDAPEDCSAIYGLRHMENCTVITKNVTNKEAYNMTALEKIAYLDRVGIMINDFNVDINPKNTYNATKDCPSIGFVVTSVIKNGYGVIKM